MLNQIYLESIFRPGSANHEVILDLQRHSRVEPNDAYNLRVSVDEVSRVYADVVAALTGRARKIVEELKPAIDHDRVFVIEQYGHFDYPLYLAVSPNGDSEPTFAIVPDHGQVYIAVRIGAHVEGVRYQQYKLHTPAEYVAIMYDHFCRNRHGDALDREVRNYFSTCLEGS